METLLRPLFSVYELLVKPVAVLAEAILKAMVQVYDMLTPLLGIPFKCVEVGMQPFERPYAAIVSPLIKPFGGILGDHKLTILSGLLLLGIMILAIRLATHYG